VLVPDAQANLAPIPDGLTDEQVLMCPDIMSTGFKGAENANIRIGDTVVVFAQGPIGLCATAGARLLGATTIIAVDGNDHRLGIAKKMGADVTLNFKQLRCGRRDHEDHRRPRCRQCHRGAGHAGHL
jgi:threonine dehydrogenase-like Zn-dependent dehydrogenase